MENSHFTLQSRCIPHCRLWSQPVRTRGIGEETHIMFIIMEILFTLGFQEITFNVASFAEQAGLVDSVLQWKATWSFLGKCHGIPANQECNVLLKCSSKEIWLQVTKSI